MRTVVILAALLLLPGCTFSRSGSQALSFDPFDLWSDTPAVAVANDSEHVDGERWNQR